MKNVWIISLGLSAALFTQFSNAAVTIPYGNSAFLYPGDYDHGAQGPNNPTPYPAGTIPNNLPSGVRAVAGSGGPGFPNSYGPFPAVTGWNQDWTSTISTFNTAVTNKSLSADSLIAYPFPYVSDIEMACKSFDSTGKSVFPPQCTPLTPPPGALRGGTGYFYGLPGDTMQTQVAEYNSSMTGISGLEGIIDGRIDNGYLQGFNTLDTGTYPNFAPGLADFVALGGNKIPASFSDYIAQGDDKAVGICEDSNLKGVQIDIEPFDVETSSDLQAQFYTQLGKDLNGCSKWFSVFTFAEKLTPAAITAITSSGNGYVIDSLYDLPYNVNPPMILTDPSDPSTVAYCTSTQAAPGCTQTAPVPVSTYETNVANEVHQMFKVAQANNIPFKFAIPAAGSAHEFESWYQRTSDPTGAYFSKPDSSVQGGSFYNSCGADGSTKTNYGQDSQALSMEPGCGKQGEQIGNTNPSTQLQYVQAAINTIACAFNGSTPDEYAAAVKNNNLFKGLALWEFSAPGTEWSPDPSVVDWNSGFISLGSYVFFSPSEVDSNVLGYLEYPATSIDDTARGHMDVQNIHPDTGFTCPTFPVDPSTGSEPAPINVKTDIECTTVQSGAGTYSCTSSVTWDEPQGDEIAISSDVRIPAAPTTLSANNGVTANTGTFSFIARGDVPYTWSYYAVDSKANTQGTAGYAVGTFTLPIPTPSSVTK